MLPTSHFMIEMVVLATHLTSSYVLPCFIKLMALGPAGLLVWMKEAGPVELGHDVGSSALFRLDRFIGSFLTPQAEVA